MEKKDLHLKGALSVEKRKLIIFGDSAFAEIAYEYFTHDSEYQVVAFTISKEYIKKTSLFDLPIIPFEEVEKHFSFG